MIIINNALQKHPDWQAHFEVKYIKDDKDDILSYNDIVNYLNDDATLYDSQLWQFQKIITHEQVRQGNPQYKGSSVNVQILWENGEQTDEPPGVFDKDAPVDCAIYVKKHDLLNKLGWKWFKPIAKREGLLNHLIQQAKIQSFCTFPKCKFGFEVPRDIEHACRLDEAAGNNKWEMTNKLEQDKLVEYSTIHDKGKFHISKILRDHKQIKVHTIFDVKYDGQHKAQCVADGHLTDTPVDSVYSGVVSLQGFQMVLFILELNGLQPYATNIDNAYLKAYTTEKLWIIVPTEFGKQIVHLLIVNKALYGLCSSSQRFNKNLGKCLHKLDFRCTDCEANI